MAKNDQQDAYDKVLTASLARVIDFVKFAEAKNAALLAFCSGWTVAIANLITKENPVPGAYGDVLPVSGSLFLIAALMALYSFIPRVKLGDFFKGEAKVSRELNLLFYGDVSEVAIDDYPARLKARYLPEEKHSATDKYFSDLSCQIHVNSTIASRKFGLFKMATWVTLLALIILVAPAAWYLLIGVVRYLMVAAQ